MKLCSEMDLAGQLPNCDCLLRGMFRGRFGLDPEKQHVDLTSDERKRMSRDLDVFTEVL